jgi:nitrogen fixation/metabolism regulation signal transduction histidine kinase
MSRPQRRQKYIDSQVQGALARRIIFHWLVFVSVAAVAALLLQVLSDPFQPAGKHIENLWYTHGPFLLVLVFLLPVFVVDTIKISHRFAGPIFSLRRTMREVADGQPPRKLKFREGDFWHELAEDYNAMIGRLAPNADDESVEQDKTPVHAAD